MSAHMVTVSIEAGTVGNQGRETREIVARRQLQSENAPVAVTGVAEAIGEALALVARLNPATTDDVVYAFRKGLTGERA